MVVLSHGENVEMYSRDKSYKVESLCDHFAGDECPTLAGKPKLFFLEVK
jgi:hypothetical protein